MAASLPWRRDEKPAEISWLASDPGGTGPADHATSDDPRRYRVGTISTSNAIRAFIFDEPTRGVDIATKVEIYRMMADLASAGMAVLLISSEMPEAIGMSDRLLVMRSGRIVAALERSELSMERVFGLAVGAETHWMTA